MTSGRIPKTLLIIPGLVALYIGSYIAGRILRPEFINTNDGPVRMFCVLYYPLRCWDAGQKSDGWQRAKITWINRGNGYLYFLREEEERRAVALIDLAAYSEGDWVQLHIIYRLETRDDFTSHWIARVDDIRKAAGPS